MQIKAVLFDIDGTLVDSNDRHVLAWEEAFAGIGAKFDRQRVHDQIGKGTDMLVPTLLPDLDEAAQEKLGEAHGRIFKAKFLREVKTFPQAHDLLAHALTAVRNVSAIRGDQQPPGGPREADFQLGAMRREP